MSLINKYYNTCVQCDTYYVYHNQLLGNISNRQPHTVHNKIGANEHTEWRKYNLNKTTIILFIQWELKRYSYGIIAVFECVSKTALVTALSNKNRGIENIGAHDCWSHSFSCKCGEPIFFAPSLLYIFSIHFFIPIFLGCVTCFHCPIRWQKKVQSDQPWPRKGIRYYQFECITTLQRHTHFLFGTKRKSDAWFEPNQYK